MSEKKPIPVFPQVIRRLCPVCGKSSYSAAGIHPQCAVARADSLHKLAIRQREAEDLLTDLASKPAGEPKGQIKHLEVAVTKTARAGGQK